MNTKNINDYLERLGIMKDEALGIKRDITVKERKAAEEDAFVHGDGNGKSLGLIYQAPVGVVTAEKGKITADDLVDLEYSVSAGHRKHGVWVMSNDAYSRVSQIVHY